MKKLKKGVKITIIILALIIISLIIKNYQENKEQEESILATQYIECLQNNFMQRDYCGKQLNQEYKIMDQLIKKYGYKYEEKGKDLIIVKVD